MQKGLLFWILMLLWLVLGLYMSWTTGGGSSGNYGPGAGTLLLFVLIALLGWKTFGPPLQG